MRNLIKKDKCKVLVVTNVSTAEDDKTKVAIFAILFNIVSNTKTG